MPNALTRVGKTKAAVSSFLDVSLGAGGGAGAENLAEVPVAKAVVGKGGVAGTDTPPGGVGADGCFLLAIGRPVLLVQSSCGELFPLCVSSVS